MICYLPSCSFTALCPKTTEAVKAYFKEKEDVTVGVCCRPMQKKMTKGDTALTICRSCAAITREASPEVTERNVFSYLLEDPDFVWPDHKGEAITLQDCWRARKDPALHEAVRECLRRMNFQIVEMAENRQNCDFDGTWRFKTVEKRNLDIAPVYFREVGDRYTEVLSEEEKLARMQAHAALYETERVTCYCNSCLKGIRLGGAKGVHLMSLIMDIDE